MTGHAVVTGGAGFLGSHIVESLLRDGRRVTVIDNYGSGRPENLEHVDEEALTLLDHDVREPFPSFDDVDAVYHFASRASPADFESYAVEIALANSEGTHNALECARLHDARTILASTSEVYGDPEVHPQHEEYRGNVNIRGPRAPYDESKRFAEALAVAYEQQHDTDVRTVRIFNTYGPRMRLDDGRVVPNFITQALRGEPLTVYGDGSQTRSFCYVTDLVSGIRSFASAPPAVAKGEAVNIGNTNEITIAKLAEMLLDIVDTESTLTYEPLPTDDPRVRRPDISKAESMLDWRPEVDLRSGLERTVAAFETRL